MSQLIVINNPNNPTGATISKSVLEPIVDFAKKRGITILADEVYSPLFHSLPEGQSAPPSILSFGYQKTISTGSMSKAFALAGIRLGWVASRDQSVLAAVTSARDYTSISVSMLDDQVAAYALGPAVLPSLLERNMNLARTNLKLLEEFVNQYNSAVSWFKPNAGTTALVQFRNKGEPVDDEAFCLDLLEQTKVMFLPAGNCFGHGKDFKGCVRVGYACHTNVLKEALAKLGEYVEKNLL
jgi:aspartate/methionine/tyrosine aminotransferase